MRVTRSRGLHGWRGFAFVVPYLPLLILFGILPMLYALKLAFTKESGAWAGFQNFTDTATDYRFMPALGHVLVYTRCGSACSSCSSSGWRCCCTGERAGPPRPSASSTTCPAHWPARHRSWSGSSCSTRRSAPDRSWCAHVLDADLFVEAIAPGNLPFIFAMIAFWTGAGGWVVVLYGALNTIPQELEDAARIDGAGPLTLALRLKLPLIRKWVAYMVILSFATGTQLFVEPQLVNQASLGMVPDTWSSNQLAYQLAFRYADFNAAAAISVDLLAIGLVGAIVIITRTGLFKADD